MKNAINWFEIPVKNYERAKAFYTKVIGTEITDYPQENMKMGVFKYNGDQQGVGGAICQMEGLNPSTDGTTVYFPGGDDLSVPLSRVEAAGGKIVIPKTNIGENGYMAHFIDTEGNKIALHSMN